MQLSVVPVVHFWDSRRTRSWQAVKFILLDKHALQTRDMTTNLSMFTFKSTMLFWLLASSVPLASSFLYFLASPPAGSLAQRIAVSLHGAAVSALCAGAVLVGMVGTPRPAWGEPFRLLLLVPVALSVYSLFHFQGNKATHLLQGINALWLALAFFFGSMAVTGVWP